MTGRHSGTQRDIASFIDECRFCHENLEAEALGILEPAERARFQRHLQWCGPCRRGLADLRQVVNLLPLLSEEATPSPMAKARLFQAVADDVVTSAHVTFGDPWAPSRPAPTTPSSTPATDPQPAAGSWTTWLASALVAPLIVALIVLGAWTNNLRNDLDSMQSGQGGAGTSTLVPASGGDGIQLYAMESSCPDCDDSPASGHLGGNPEDNVGILVAWNLDPNQPHQVWCEKRNGELLLVSDLEVERTGQVAQTVSFPEAIGDYSRIYVTRHDGTEEMRVALHEDIPVDPGTPEGDDPAGQ